MRKRNTHMRSRCRPETLLLKIACLRVIRIIRDFYLKLDAALKKPKIFGMTASPVDGEADEEDVMLRARQVLVCLWCSSG